MSEQNKSFNRRALIGGLAGVIVVGGGAGVAAGVMGKSEVAPAPAPAPSKTQAPVEEYVPRKEAPVEEAKPELKQPAAPEPVPYVDHEPERDTFDQAQIDKETEDALKLPPTGAKPVGQ